MIKFLIFFLTIGSYLANAQVKPMSLSAVKSKITELTPIGTDRVTAEKVRLLTNMLAEQLELRGSASDVAGLLQDIKTRTSYQSVLTLRASSFNRQTAPGVVLITDAGKSGTFVLDASDSTTPDNLGTCLVTSAGLRYKRRFDRDALYAGWFGVIGDAITNNVPMLQAALNYASANGISRVQMPSGRFILSGTSSVSIPPGISLIGAPNVPNKSGFGSDFFQFEITIGEGSTKTPAFIMKEFSGIQGFSFLYPNQLAKRSTPLLYGWTITTDGTASQDGIQLRNLMLTNSYQGIHLDNGGQHTLENIFGQPLLTGIELDREYDVPHMNNIHFWTFWAAPGTNLYNWMHINGTAIRLRRVDALVGSNIIAYGYKQGIHLAPCANGDRTGPWVSLSNVAIDVSDSPVVIDALNRAQFTNLTLTGSSVATSQDAILINNSVSNIGSSLEINGLAMVNLTTGIRNKGVLRALITGLSKPYILNISDGIRWYDVINENDNGNITYFTDKSNADFLNRISGRVTVNGWTNYANSINITPAGFATPHSNWKLTPSGSTSVTRINNGSKFTIPAGTGGISQASFVMPSQIVTEKGLFAIKLTLKVDTKTTLGGTQFYIRLRNYTNNIDYRITASGVDPYFNSTTTLTIPFVFSGPSNDSYIDFAYGANNTSSPVSFDVTGLELLKLSGYSTAYVENMPRHQNFTSSFAASTQPFSNLGAPPQATGDIMYYNGNSWIGLPIGKSGQFLKVVSGLPTWSN